MKKITELKELKWKPIHYWDDNRNLIHDREEYIGNRNVRSISAGPRFAHFIIDHIVYTGFYYFVDYLFQLLINYTTFSVTINLTINLISSILFLVLYPLYYSFFEYKWQRTPGKFITKSLVINEFGNKPDIRKIILRSIIRLIPFEPFSCFGNFSRGWHDRWSNTWVVTEEELADLQRLLSEKSETL